MSDEIRTRNDFAPDDTEPPIPRASSSLTPGGKVTQQLGLMSLLGLDLVVALVAAMYRLESPGLWNTVSTALGGILGLLTGVAIGRASNNR